MKLRHYDHQGDARFITVVCHNRLPLLLSQEAAETFLEILAWWKIRYEIQLLAYVIMPEHVHMVLIPKPEAELGPTIGVLKARSATEIVNRLQERLPLRQMIGRRNGKLRRVFWLRRCYDRNCRSQNEILTKVQYCHQNPVRRGLVSRPEDWRFSSYRSWYSS